MKPIHAGLVGLALLAGCNNDNVMAATERAYNQIQRLGNPLVSEVFLAKRSHPVRGAGSPVHGVRPLGQEHLAHERIAEALNLVEGPLRDRSRRFVFVASGRREGQAEQGPLHCVAVFHRELLVACQVTVVVGWLSG